MEARMLGFIAGLVLGPLWCIATRCPGEAFSRAVTERFMQRLLIKKVEPKRPTDGVHIRGVVHQTIKIERQE